MFIPQNGARICSACRHRRRKGRLTHRVNPVLCDCGQPAVTVIELHVGEDGCYTTYMPLCEACLRLEQEISGKKPG